MNPKSDPKTVKNSPILNFFSAKQAAVLKRNKRFL